jgi:5-methylthioribose kinase
MEGDATEGVIAALRRIGLLDAKEHPRLIPLTGGVASDIWRVDAKRRSFVVKQALPKLRVAAEWHAPTSRNASEMAWMRMAARIAPDAVPEVLAHDPASSLFAMTWLPPETFPVWKGILLGGRADPGFAAQVGATIGAIHAATARDNDVAAQFANDDVFHAIRLEPYLEATARRHPALSDALMALSRGTLATRVALVHGDVSPKNILAAPQGPVFLDAECAWYGDPAFDLAFCLNHLLLKCLWTPRAMSGFLACFDALAHSYLRAVNWEAKERLEQRAARLLPALFLARVDGKSPVEYVTDEADKNRVRATAAPLIAAPPARLSEIRAAWAKVLSSPEGRT